MAMHAAGTPVLQPGSLDGRTPADRIGEIERTIPINMDGNNVVAGTLIRLDDGVEAINYIPDVGQIHGTVGWQDLDGRTICTVGRTSGLREGVITAVELDGVAIYMGEQSVPVFSGLIQTTAISQAGDSGVPVITDDGRLLVFCPINKLYNDGSAVAGEYSCPAVDRSPPSCSTTTRNPSC